MKRIFKMDFILDFLSNKFFITAMVSWTVAQVLKVIIFATISALTFGLGSFEFAISGILAVIVCHDAMGVRLEAGKHAKLLKLLVDAFEKFSKNELPEVVLKEFVGHTPLQVITGIFLGIFCACAMHFFVFA